MTLVRSNIQIFDGDTLAYDSASLIAVNNPPDPAPTIPIVQLYDGHDCCASTE